MVREFSLLLMWIALVCSGAQAQSLDCNFDTNFCSWTQTGWNQWKGPTHSSDTGPDQDHTGGGSYIYLEALIPNTAFRATLLSPNVTIPSGGCLTFWYHMYGLYVGLGVLSVYVGPSSQLVWTKHGDQGNSWKQASVDLPAGVNMQVKIEATVGNGTKGDIGLDDITFTSNGCSNPNKPKHGEPCTGSVECDPTEGTQCLSGTCSCGTNEFFDDTTNVCTAKPKHGEPCLLSVGCNITEGTQCLSGTCSCGTNEFYHGTTNVCTANDVTTTSSTQHVNGGVLISSTVDTVYTGLTASLTITCSVPSPSVGGYDNLVSLVISKFNNVSNKLEDIVSIDSFTPGVINTLQPTQAKANALFNNSGTSYLELLWENPQKSDTGFYQCESTVLDNSGHPITLTSGLDIKHADPTITALMETFRLHEEQMEDQFTVLRKQMDELKNLRNRISMAAGSMEDKFTVLKNQTDEWKDKFTVLKNQTDELKDKFTVLRNQTDELKNRFSMTIRFMFDSTNATNGWTYHFSKFPFGDVDRAEAACNLVNGHLVDFENKAEYDLVIGYINSGIYTSTRGYWLIGLSDEATEGTWLVRHSGQPAGYIQWHSGEPNTASYDCSSVYKVTGDMYDYPCTYTSDVPSICKSRQ